MSQLRHLMINQSDADEQVEPDPPLEFPAASLLAEGVIDPETYPVGPGDRLQLIVWGAIEVMAPLIVSAEGRIFVPNVGMVDVRGLSLAEARRSVLRKVSETYNRVHVDLVLTHMRQFKVHVVGAVRKPGSSLPATAVTRVSEVIFAAGGVIDVASYRRIVMHRPDGVRVPVDLAGFELTGRLDLNPPLVDGAVIEVPRRTHSVLLSGAVANPGQYEPIPGERLSEFLDALGGLHPGADTERIVYSHFASDIDHVERDIHFIPGDETGDPVIVDGDRIFVRTRENFHANAEVFVYGAARRPGRVPIPVAGRRLSEVIAEAGGFTTRASLPQAHILRPTERYVPPPEEPNPQTYALDRAGFDYAAAADQLDSVYVACDFSALFDDGVSEEDVWLYGGDVVHIPENRSEVRVIGSVRQPGSYAYQPGRSIGDYIGTAGGYDKDADKGRTRVASFAGGPLRRPVDDEVMNGAVIFVPAKNREGRLQRTRDIASILAQVASLVLIIDRLGQ